MSDEKTYPYPAARLQAEGKCIRCRAARDGKSKWHCVACAAKNAAYTKGRQDKRRADKVCVACGRKPFARGSYCDECYARLAVHVNARKRRLVAAGLCRCCGGEKAECGQLCRGCRSRDAERRRAKRKAEAAAGAA